MNAVEFVVRVVRALDKLNVPYMAVGSFSTNIYSTPRSTKDADFVVELGDVPISAIAAELGPEFQLDPQMSFETITATMRYRFRHHDTAFVVELFLLSHDAHDQARFSRRIKATLNELPVYFPTVEDVIVTKLRWSRQGQRPKDMEDVRRVLAVQRPNLDLLYIRHWCDQHGTRELFERLLAESTAI